MIIMLVIINIMCLACLLFGLIARSSRPSASFLALNVVGLASVVAALLSAYCSGHTGFDYAVFWNAGTAIRLGRNPYNSLSPGGFPFLNPPPFFPIAALISLVPFRVGEALWMVFNLIGSFALCFLARQIIAESSEADERLDDRTVFAMACTVTFSFASYAGLRAGQLSVLTTLALLLAILAAHRSHAGVAGLCLAIASSKVATMLPFVILFLRRRSNYAVLAVFSLSALIMSVMYVKPFSLPSVLRDNLHAIVIHGEAGRINDYVLSSGPASFNMIGLDRLVDCLGIHDRSIAKSLQLIVIGLLGISLAFEILWRRRLSDAASCSLVACYAMLFLYHRFVDTLILCLPLVYAVGHCRSAPPRRWPMVVAVAALLGAMQGSGDLLYGIYDATRASSLVGRVVQVVIVPIPIWLIIVAMSIIWSDARRTNPFPPADR
ncbi:MAG: glycosyltransferase 87 family protein [Isosphaeraceae bacterium]